MAGQMVSSDTGRRAESAQTDSLKKDLEGWLEAGDIPKYGTEKANGPKGE